MNINLLCCFIKKYSLFLLIVVSSAIMPALSESAPEGSGGNVLLRHGGVVIYESDADAILEGMAYSEKQYLKHNKDKLQEILLDVLVSKRMTSVAVQQGLDRKPKTAWKLENARNKILEAVLVEDYKKTISTPEDLIQGLAREYYDSHPAEFTEKKKVHIAHILFRVKEKDDQLSKEKQKKVAVHVLEEIQRGMDFSLAAKKYSEDELTAEVGGDLGFFESGVMMPAFEEASFALRSIGDLSGVVKTTYGFHIIKLLAVKNEAIKPYSQVKLGVVKKVKSQYIANKLNEYVDSFQPSGKTVLYVPAIDAYYRALQADRQLLPSSN